MMCLGEKHVIPGWHTSSFPGENHEDVRRKKGAVTVWEIAQLGVGNGAHIPWDPGHGLMAERSDLLEKKLQKPHRKTAV